MKREFEEDTGQSSEDWPQEAECYKGDDKETLLVMYNTRQEILKQT